MTEPVSNPYKLSTCETCHHAIWDRAGCYCNRVPSKMHKVCETGTCEHWALSQYIEVNPEGTRSWSDPFREDPRSTANLVKVIEALCLILTNCTSDSPFLCDYKCPQKDKRYKQLHPDCPWDTIHNFQNIQREMTKNE